MQTVYLTADELRAIAVALGAANAGFDALCAALDRAAGTKDVPSRNKPLAQGKSVKRGAKGKPAKAGIKARKGTRKK